MRPEKLRKEESKMAGKKPIPAHDVEVGGGSGGGGGGRGYRPTPKSGGSAKKALPKMSRKGQVATRDPEVTYERAQNRDGNPYKHKLKRTKDAKAKKILREMAAKKGGAKVSTTPGKAGIVKPKKSPARGQAGDKNKRPKRHFPPREMGEMEEPNDFKNWKEWQKWEAKQWKAETQKWKAQDKK
jgi:hypothetical protein